MNNFTIRQGDQYAIPFRIAAGGVAVTPENCDDLRIQVGCLLKSYKDKTVSYDTEKALWLFPVSETDTASLRMAVAYQIGVKVGDEFIYSSTGTILVDDSIIRKEWSS